MNLYLNGEYLPIEAGRISVEDRGFQFGDGVYEVIRVYGGKPFRLREHLARLAQSLEGLEIRLPEPLERIGEVCLRVLGSLKEATVYIQVTRGAAPRVHAFPAGLRPTRVVYAREAKPFPPEKSFSLMTLPDDRWGRCHLKTICLLPNILGKERAVRAGCDEGLFVREDGTVTEGTSSNAFIVRGGAAFTHPATNRILNGVTRLAVIEVARAKGVPVEERACSIGEVRAADEIFMTGTTTEVMPAVALDGRAVGAGRPGPVTLRVAAGFRELVRRETEESGG
jgi:D-alanine transaminase